MEIIKCHHQSLENVIGHYQTDLEKGLTVEQVQKNLREHGHNELKERPKPGFLEMLLDQFNNFLVIILIIAAVISLLLGEIGDAVAIMVIVALNAIVGVIQESKAEQALAALQKMSAPNAQVIREGHVKTLPSREIVPGDVVLIESGNYVPADLRLFESVNLKIEEASLTGESVPVEKNAGVVLAEEIALGDKINCAFMGTVVTYGRGKGIVAATGMHTEIGLIAEMLESYEEEATPLQVKLDQMAKILGVSCLFICAVIFIYGLIRDTHLLNIFNVGFSHYLAAEKKDIIDLFMAAVSLAIAAVPEGLPAVVTICLALGMQRMIKRHALIRKLPAVETLGCATVICSDKTGTLTQNEMTVVEGWSDGRLFQISRNGQGPGKSFLFENKNIHPLDNAAVGLMLHGALLCNDARLEDSGKDKGEKSWRIVGDPTEGAMVVAAAKAGLFKDEAEKIFPRVMEIPFDSERKCMTTIHQSDLSRNSPLKLDLPPVVAFVKGAPDVILGLSASIYADGQISALDSRKKEHILQQNQKMAQKALRVLGVACKPLQHLPDRPDSQSIEQELVFLGLMGMIDPPRPEVKEAVRIAQGAGLRTVMITGDYKDTAEAVAREIGLLRPKGKVISGAQLDQMDDGRLTEIIQDMDVCCRVSPKHKTRIVDVLKATDHIVAMTGDGVNDAPALKRANIGIAMGITGTDVTKETADMVLTDDNYASIVSAIEEGRTIYSNIRKFVNFLLVCNIGEILIVFFAMLIGLPLPFKPIMLLWLNLVSDGAPALALGLEKAEPDIMQRPPRPCREPVINREMAWGLMVVPLVDMVAILSVFKTGLSLYPGNLAAAQTMAFVALCVSELLRAYTARSEYLSIFSIGIFSNQWMQAAVGSSLLLVLITVYVPFLRPFFGTVFLGLNDWLVILPYVFLAPAAAEIVKLFNRRRVPATV